FPSRPNLDRTFRQFTSFNLPFRDRHFSPSQTRRDSCTRDVSQFASIISCIRAIILSSICCPPTFTDANLQNHFSRVQQKMRDTKSSGRGREARPSRGAFAPPLPSRKRVYDHRGFHPPQCITVAFLRLSGGRPLPKTLHCRLALLDSIHE